MIGEIWSAIENEKFDYAVYLCPSDTNTNMLDEFSDNYRHIYAISKVLAPKNMICMGVGYGYSAISLLKASPSAKLIGVCNVNETDSGRGMSLEWAKKITREYDVKFVNDVSSLMDLNVDVIYDLVILDANVDGDTVYKDLELAFGLGRWVLINNCFSPLEKMLSINFFIQKYNMFIENALLVPGFGGELLIYVKQTAPAYFRRKNVRYSELDCTYDSEYYLTDCGGYDSFRKYHGRIIEDPRLLAVLDIIDPCNGKKILDLGCGRGELAYAMAKSGASVIAVDYSKDAISIAESTFSGEKYDLEFMHCDFLEKEFDELFDCIAAADVVEHVEQPMLEKMICKSSVLLKPEGIFVVHTAPNLLQLEYENKQRRKIARQIGTYLPVNPRTYYADLQHLNEQSPAKLNRVMRKYYKYVLTWNTTLPDRIGNLLKPVTKNSLREGTSIFSIASHSPINIEGVLKSLKRESLLNTTVVDKRDIGSFERIKGLLRQASTSVNVGAEVTPMYRFTGVARRLALVVGKIIIYLSSFITIKQRTFNAAVVSALVELVQRIESDSINNTKFHTNVDRKIEDINKLLQDQQSKIDKLYDKYSE